MQGKENALQSLNKTRQSKRHYKCKDLVIDYIKSEVEKGTGLTFLELKKQYTEDQLFHVALKHVTTTKKALCMAMEIPIEAGCRYKRELEKNGLLVQSIEEDVCPYTNHMAHLISTNADEFERLTSTSQLKLF